jgi:hypothetical protein
MMKLSDKWAPRLLAQPESGMGYQIVTVHLVDGRVFENVTVVGDTITTIKNHNAIPFAEAEISDLVVSGSRGRN